MRKTIRIKWKVKYKAKATSHRYGAHKVTHFCVPIVEEHLECVYTIPPGHGESNGVIPNLSTTAMGGQMHLTTPKTKSLSQWNDSDLMHSAGTTLITSQVRLLLFRKRNGKFLLGKFSKATFISSIPQNTR